jgi:hypothetical protein
LAKKAALQELHLRRVLMEQKADLFDGNQHFPEPFYWSHRAASIIRAMGMAIPANIPNYRCHDHACANCKVAPSASVVIQICGHCSGILQQELSKETLALGTQGRLPTGRGADSFDARSGLE